MQSKTGAQLNGLFCTYLEIRGGKKSLNLDTLQMRGGMMHDVKTTSNGTKMCGRYDSLTMAPTLYVAAGVSVWL